MSHPPCALSPPTFDMSLLLGALAAFDTFAVVDKALYQPVAAQLSHATEQHNIARLKTALKEATRIKLEKRSPAAAPVVTAARQALAELEGGGSARPR